MFVKINSSLIKNIPEKNILAPDVFTNDFLQVFKEEIRKIIYKFFYKI